MNINQLFVFGRFEARTTPRFVVIFEQIVLLPLTAFWIGGGLLVFFFVEEERMLAGVLFPLWLLAVVLAAAALHRAGRVRAVVSFGTTFLVLLATCFAWFSTRS